MRAVSKKILLAFSVFALATQVSLGEPWKGEIIKHKKAPVKAGACLPATGSSDLDINNVRARINTGGDMWWDFEVARYEVPKGSSKVSMFSASLWIGGKDANGQLKVAALRFRQSGNDYWPGPLTLAQASVDQATCNMYDKHFKMTRAEVEEHIAKWNESGYEMPRSIRDWPAHPIDGNTSQSFYLAPFFDANGDGVYNPEEGDYPYYDFNNELCPRNLIQTNPTTGKIDTILPRAKTMDEQKGDVTGSSLMDQVLKGDQTLWWVFNDKGAAHTESGGEPIGLEIRAQAFAFATNDEINNMTFYSYEIINRSSYIFKDTYFSQWVDVEVGYAYDDYVGCDVERGLGYAYNGYDVDGVGRYDHYGANPPAVGVDFFQGPYMDPDGCDNPSYKGDGLLGPSFAMDPNYNLCDIVTKDSTWITMVYGEDFTDTVRTLVSAAAINGVNFGDGIVDNERYGMRRFVYHNNGGTIDAISDPGKAVEYYNMLRGIWKDNQRMLYGGNAYNNGATTVECDFMFPGDTDPCWWGTKGTVVNEFTGGKIWTEAAMGNPVGDRRFMQSAGPFTLQPGAVNYITVGIPWARATVGSAWASVELLRVVDDKCQALFDNCFKVLDGPTCPEIVIQELDKELILYLRGGQEDYEEVDATIPTTKLATVVKPVSKKYTIVRNGVQIDTTILEYVEADTVYHYDNRYRFEGYQIYQVANENVSVAEIRDNAKARLVAQCDIENYDENGNPISRLINYEYDESLGAVVPVEMTTGSNAGIVKSFRVTTDLFASSDNALVNNKKYYFIAIAYAYNNYATYSQTDADGLEGQKAPYLAGRKTATGAITSVVGIPHNTDSEAGGTLINALYGSGPSITRVEGYGNGGLVLDLTDETVSEILKNGKAEKLTYKNDAGPLNIKVVDPLRVADGEYTIMFKDTTDEVSNDAEWILVRNYVEDGTAKTDTIHSEASIGVNSEQLLLELGISLQIYQYNQDLLYTDEDVDANLVHNLVSCKVLKDSMDFHGGQRWIQFVTDNDGESTWNWIRSGTVNFGDEPEDKERLWEDFMAEVIDGNRKKYYVDPNQEFENACKGMFAPYCLSSYILDGPAYWPLSEKITYDMHTTRVVNLRNVHSVDIVFTENQELWTRCPVLEAYNGDKDQLDTIRWARKLDIKNNPSVGKDGKPDGTGTGMGWFPGYAIDVETGERLNMMFAEDRTKKNGNDMIFNPTSDIYEYDSTAHVNRISWGGKHYIYVVGHNYMNTNLGGANNAYINVIKNQLVQWDCPAYDEGKWLHDKLVAACAETVPANKDKGKLQAFNNIMWTAIPVAISGREWLSSDLSIKLRVAFPYRRYLAQGQVAPQTVQNDNYPMYQFGTSDLVPSKGNVAVAKAALDRINVVPNPYYARSNYEATQLENIVKITNLPDNCVVSIYSINGLLVRRFTRAVDSGNAEGSFTNSIDWDLKNSADIPISGGLYLIHVKAPGIGEKTIKWFGALRQTDLNAF